MPCTTATITVPAEPSATINSVNFSPGENSGTLNFTVENTGNVDVQAEVSITVTNDETNASLQSETMYYDVNEGRSSDQTVDFNFDFSEDTRVQVCADVVNATEVY